MIKLSNSDIMQHQMNIMLEITKLNTIHSYSLKTWSANDQIVELDIMDNETNQPIILIMYQWEHIRYKPNQKLDKKLVKEYDKIAKLVSGLLSYKTVDYM